MYGLTTITIAYKVIRTAQANPIEVLRHECYRILPIALKFSGNSKDWKRNGYVEKLSDYQLILIDERGHAVSIIAGACMIVLTTITIAYKVIRTAQANPIEVLRHE